MIRGGSNSRRAARLLRAGTAAGLALCIEGDRPASSEAVAQPQPQTLTLEQVAGSRSVQVVVEGPVGCQPVLAGQHELTCIVQRPVERRVKIVVPSPGVREPDQIAFVVKITEPKPVAGRRNGIRI